MQEKSQTLYGQTTIIEDGAQVSRMQIVFTINIVHPSNAASRKQHPTFSVLRVGCPLPKVHKLGIHSPGTKNSEKLDLGNALDTWREANIFKL
jgi:hypothetical protein